MFPCASHSNDEPKIDSGSFDNKTYWLQSSTYSEPKLIVHTNEAANIEKERGSKSVKRPSSSKNYKLEKKQKVTSTAIFLEDIPGLDINDAYRIDRSCNREIYKHGCIYEKHVSQFKQKSKTKILGFKDLYLYDLLGCEVKRKRGLTKKSRYFSKSSRAITQSPSTVIKSSDKSDMSTDLIRFPDDLSTCVSTTGMKNNDILNLCEELNRRVYDRPGDLISWLNLIDLQDKGASFLHITSTGFEQKQLCSDFKFSKSDRLIILRKQLSMADRALTANPGNLTLKLFIIKTNELVAELEAHGALESSSNKEVCQADQINRDWAQLVFTYPQLVPMWRGYTAHLMGRHSSLTTVNQGIGNGVFSRIDGVYKRGLSTLSGIISGRILSHRPQPDTVERTIDYLADYCHWLAQAGHSERALAVWQAVIEFNCFRPTEIEQSSFEQRILEMELFWSSGTPRFGQPGSQHWNGWFKTRNKRQDKSQLKESKLSKSHKKNQTISPIISEITSDMSVEELHSKWTSVAGKLTAIASTCEDALISCSGEGIPDESYENTGPDVVPSILSSEVAADQWVRRGSIPSLAGHGSFGKSRAILYRRGKAWVGLERAREAVGWLPSDVLNAQDQKDIEEEDPERLVLFDDIKPCLIDLWKFEEKSTADTPQSRARRALFQQRLFLLCLEFLGAYDRDIAKSHHFPMDIRLVHDLASVGSIQRQGLTPFPSQSWMSSNIDTTHNRANNNDGNNKGQLNTPSQLANEHQDVWAQAHRCFIDAALTQMNLIPSWWPTELKENWRTTLSKLRFTLASERLSNAIQTHLVNVKTAISIWRNCGRAIISEGKNQKDLNLWRSYAKGFWQISHDLLVTSTCQDAAIPIQESRRIFDSALSMYPIPEDFGPPIDDMDKLVEFYQTVYTPRLKLLQDYIDLEMDVCPGSGSCQKGFNEENRVLYLLTYTAIGGVYHSYEQQSTNEILPSIIVKTNYRFGKRIEAIWTTLVGLPEDLTTQINNQAFLDGLLGTVPIICYLNLMFDLLTTDEKALDSSLASLLPILGRIDRLCSKFLSINSDESYPLGSKSNSRWSENINSSDGNNDDLIPAPLQNRICTNKFINLTIGGLSAFCALRQRNRRPLLNYLFQLIIKHNKYHSNDILMDLMFPSQLSYLLPSRISLDQRKLPLSLMNASSCHGLLPPLFLASLIHQLNHLRQNVAKLASQSIIQQTLNSISRSNIRQNQQQDINFFEGSIGAEVNSLIGHQLELCSACLPSVLDLFVLSLELERWTSLIAGVACDYGDGRNSVSDQRVRNAFEKAVQITPFFTSFISPEGNLVHVALGASTPSFWSAHLRLIIWRAYMAFGWMAGPPHTSNISTTIITNNLDPRQRRQAVKAVFYRAVEDVPWAKALYTDLVRYCPEDVEEVVDLLSERELRLRTPLEEVDLLLTARPHE
uniref:Protein NRDE2 homolog n=1 Tax=Schistosoma mansoni TaxID=6183 RepID=A0A3Q0KR46_SCHMA